MVTHKQNGQMKMPKFEVLLTSENVDPSPMKTAKKKIMKIKIKKIEIFKHFQYWLFCENKM